MANARIDVYLHSNDSISSNSNENLTSAVAVQSQSPQTSEGAASTRQVKGMAIATMVAAGAFNYITSNVGKYSGNTQNQIMVNNVQQGISYAAMFAVNPYLAIGTLAVGGIQRALDENWRRKTEAVSMAQSQARAGYTSSKDVVSRRNK